MAAKLESVPQLGRQFLSFGKSPSVFQKGRITNSSRTLCHQDYGAPFPHSAKNIGNYSNRMVEVTTQHAPCRYDDDVQLAVYLRSVNFTVARDSFPENRLQITGHCRDDSSQPVGH